MENITAILNEKDLQRLGFLNEKDLENLGSLIKEIIEKPNEVVIFLGNGISRLAGAPSWDDLATCLLEWYYKDYGLHYDIYKFLNQNQDSIEKISIAYEFLKKEIKQDFEQIFQNKLKTILIPEKNSKKEIKFNRIYEYLSDLQVSYITTNYYTGLYNNTTNSQLNKIFFDDFSHPEMFNRNDIAYIHGEINKPNLNDIVLTLEQYLRKYTKDNNPISYFLKKIFEKKTVLFVGFGLRENEIIQHLVPIERGQVKHYLLRPRFEYEEYIDDEYENYYKSLSIKLINYNISKKGYDVMEDILLYMSNKVIEERDKIDFYKNKQKKDMLPFIRE